MTFSNPTPPSNDNGKRKAEDDRGYQERNLCIAYGDHDDCPYREIDTDGVLTFCNCSCHLDPDTIP